MKTQHLLLAGALGLSALSAAGAVGYSYWKQSSDETAAPIVAATTTSPQSRQFSRAGDRLMEAAKVDDAIQLARAFQRDNPADVAGYDIEARALAMNGDIAGAVASGGRAVALETRANARHKPRPWLDELLVVQKRYPKLRLFALREKTGESASDREFGALQKRAQTLLRAGNYDEIETVAAKLLQTRAKFAGGNWKLPCFARALCIARGDDNAWKANNQRLLLWHAQRPQSRLATLMLARSWASGAERARGGEYADKVKPQQWSGMNRRLRAAAPLFAASMGDIKRSPLVFSGLQQWALLGQVPPEIYETAWRDAEAAFPGYAPFYIEKAIYLMPRWYGEPGQWEAFARSADKIGGVRGDKLYAQIVEDQSENYDTEFFQISAVSWERTKRGLRALIANSSDSTSAAMIAQRLAAIAQDSPFERELFSGPLAREFTRMSGKPNDDFLTLCRNRIHAFAT